MKPRQTHAILRCNALHTVKLWYPLLHPVYRRAGRQRTEVFFNPLFRLRRIEIARDHQGRVVGHVIGLEEFFDIIQTRRRQILHASDHRP